MTRSTSSNRDLWSWRLLSLPSCTRLHVTQVSAATPPWGLSSHASPDCVRPSHQTLGGVSVPVGGQAFGRKTGADANKRGVDALDRGPSKLACFRGQELELQKEGWVEGVRERGNCCEACIKHTCYRRRFADKFLIGQGRTHCEMIRP